MFLEKKLWGKKKKKVGDFSREHEAFYVFPEEKCSLREFLQA